MHLQEYFIGRPIESLQTMLRHISDIDASILPVIPNGAYNSNTYASVRSFQEVNGLQPSGITDQITWEAISEKYDSITPSRNAPITQPSWDTDQSVSSGQFNYHIYLVQAMLRALSDFFPSVPSPASTGILDMDTQQGLRLIQNAAGIEDNGELNTATWYYLNAFYRAMIADGRKQGTA